MDSAQPVVYKFNRFANIDSGSLSDSEINSLVAVALDAVSRKYESGRTLCIDKPGKLMSYLRLELLELKHEIFGVIYLDNKHRIIEMEHLFRGSISGCSVYPRTVAERCLELKAAAICVYHNHPSGDYNPSSADIRLTRRLKDTLSLLDVRFLDHIIVGSDGCLSFAEKGYI